MQNLGKQARDKVTGFNGIIIGKINYLFGCAQYGIAPEAREGKVCDTNWFDEGRIEITGEGVTVDEVKGPKPGGVNRDCPK